MNDQTEHVVRVLKQVLVEVCNNPISALTEADLQAIAHHQLGADLSSREGSRFAVHAEMPFRNWSEHLKRRPDLTVIETSALSTEVTSEFYPRKGFTYKGSSILIELKLCRGHEPIALSDLKEDIRKLADLERHLYSDPQEDTMCDLIFVYLSKSAISEEEQQELEVYARANGVTPLLRSSATTTSES